MSVFEGNRFIYQTETHYDQLDAQMLLHHPRYFVFVERAQQAWIEALLGAARFDWENHDDMYLVVRKLDAEYLVPVDGVKSIRVVLWPTQMRAATLRLSFRIESPAGETLYCRGERLNCKVDQRTHQPRLWSDQLRSAVEGLLASGVASAPMREADAIVDKRGGC